MKKILAAFGAAALMLASTGMAMAAPWVPAGNQVTPNDKFVAYYPDGKHSIAGFDGDFYGRDLVMRRGNDGQFQQWFEGTSPDGNYVAIHSVWNLAKNDCACPNTWITVANANPSGSDVGWGDYLVEGATYCVHNNYYQGTK